MTATASPGRLEGLAERLHWSGTGKLIARTAGFNMAIAMASGLGSVVVARALGPTGRGEYAAIIAWFGISCIVGQMGLPAALCFYVAKDPQRARDYVATSRAMMLATGMLAFIAGLLLAPVLSRGNPAVADGYRIAFGISIVTYVGIVYTYSLQPRHLLQWNVVRTIQPVLGLLILCILSFLKLLTLDTSLFILAGTLTLQLVWGYWYCRRNALASGRARVWLLRPLAAYGLAQIAALTPATLNAQLDQLVLSQTVAPAVLGRYAIAVSLASLPIPLVAAIGNVAFPRLAAQRVVTDATRRMQRNAIVASAGIAAAMLVPLAMVAYWLIPFVFGADYRGAVPLLWILTPGAVFLSCGQVAGDLLRGRNRPAVVAWAQGLAAVFTVVLLIALLPVIGVYGAAIASTAAYGVALAAMLRSLHRLPRQSDTTNSAISSAWERAALSEWERARLSGWERARVSSTADRFWASLRRMSLLDALIISSCGIALVAILAFLPRISDMSGNFWLAVLWLTWLASLAWALTRSSFSVIFTALMLSMFIFIIVPATGAQLYSSTVLADINYQAGVIPALKISVLAQVTMLAGAMGARALRPAHGFDRIAIKLSAARLNKAAVIAVTVAVSGVIGMTIIGGASLHHFFVYTTYGGYGTFWNELHANLGFLVAVQCVGCLAIVLLPLELSATCSRRRVLPVAVAALASLVLLGSGQRGPFVAAASAAGLVWLKTSKKRHGQRRAVMTGALLLLLITGLIGVARAAASHREVTFGNVVAEPFGAGNNLFLPLAGLSTTVPSEIPYLHGGSYLQVFVLPIPRGLWSAKPADDITTVTTRFDPGKSGLYFPAFGESYADFGLIGVALCGIVLGGVAEFLHRRFANSQDLKSSVAAAVQAAVFLQLFSRGDLAPMLTTYIGLLVATGYIGRRRSAVLAPVAIPWRRQTDQRNDGQWAERRSLSPSRLELLRLRRQEPCRLDARLPPRSGAAVTFRLGNARDVGLRR